jgi:pimeloyl-ACP methyl ester carboxylesterase
MGAVAVLTAAALWRQRGWLIRAELIRQRRAAGLQRAQVDAAGHRWVYAQRAATAADASTLAPTLAPTLVMLHGFTGSKENWYPLATSLAKSLADSLGNNARLLIPDLPGWGESQRKPGSVYGYAEQAAHVAAFIEALSPGQPVILLGHSMGGGIAALCAARYPQLICKLGLFNAAGVRFADNPFGLAVLAGDNPFAVFDTRSLHRYINTVFFSDSAKPWIPWPASSALIQQRRHDARFEQAVLHEIGRSPDAMLPGDEAVHIRQPTLLLWGRDDAVIDPSAMALYAQRIPQAQQVLLEACGHMSLAEHPDQVAAAVLALMAAGP